MFLGKIILGLFLAIGVVHALALWGKWYFFYPWIDIPMHIAGGVLTVVFLFWIFEKRQDEYLFVSPRWLSFLLTLSFVAFVGVLWEFFEFFYDVFISPTRGFFYVAQMGVADTIKDLFFDLLGGLIVWVAIVRGFGKNKKVV